MANLNNLNHFEFAHSTINTQRSRFPLCWSHKTTMKSGDLVPIFNQEVLPGDTFKIDVRQLLRMLTPAVPVMDNSFIDIYFFFVPNRLACKHPNDWQKIHGQNFDGVWANDTEYDLENTGNTFVLANKEVQPQSVASYYGFPICPPGQANDAANNIPYHTMLFRGYVNIYNEWFRDQNAQNPVDFDTWFEDNAFKTGGCLHSNKFHDYFTSALPAPQKGASVLVPLLGEAPVFLNNSLNSGRKEFVYNITTGDKVANGDVVSDGTGNLESNSIDIAIGRKKSEDGTSNMYADLSEVSGATINSLRLSFAIQRLLEKDARGGTRYVEMLKAHFGTTIPDATLQRPEYLGGKRIPINVDQVVQSVGLEGGPLGTLGAFSNTYAQNRYFIKSFNEYGYIHGIATIRTRQSYSQGVPRHLSRLRRFDYYYPVFANIGETPILNKEIFLGQSFNELIKSEDVFGYNEAWADLRNRLNMVSGYFAPQAGDAILSTWTYCNQFAETPTLSAEFMEQSPTNIGDTLVKTDTESQFICDFYFDVEATRPLPVYSIPGLIDHN